MGQNFQLRNLDTYLTPLLIISASFFLLLLLYNYVALDSVCP